jgi:hypothetical protein
LDKGNKIPSMAQLYNSKEKIIKIWELVMQENEARFINEIKFDLPIYSEIKKDNWSYVAFEGLVKKCEYMVKEKGYEGWIIK